MIISTAQPPISFIASLVLSAADSTLENHGRKLGDRFREHLLECEKQRNRRV